MFVNEVMSRHPEALSDDTTIKQAASEMQKHDFGFLPVEHNGKLVGVVTDRDLTIRALSKGLDPNKSTLKEAMTKKIYYCHESDDITTAAEMMSDKQVNRLAVFDSDDHLSGIISIGDIVRKCKDLSLSGRLAEAIHQK